MTALTDLLSCLRSLSAKGTPGPWARRFAARADNTGGRDAAILDADLTIIAEAFEHVGKTDLGFDQRPAAENAALIASMRNNLDTLLALAELCVEAERVMAHCSDCAAEIALSPPEKSRAARWHAKFDALAASVKGGE